MALPYDASVRGPLTIPRKHGPDEVEKWLRIWEHG